MSALQVIMPMSAQSPGLGAASDSAGERNCPLDTSAVTAQRVPFIRSVLVTLRLRAVDEYIYLVELLQRIGLHPAKRPIELSPRMSKDQFAHGHLRSDTHKHDHDPNHTAPGHATTT